MSVDDRDCFDERATVQLATYGHAEHAHRSAAASFEPAHPAESGGSADEVPAFLAVGSGLFDTGGDPLEPAADPDRDGDITQPIPRMTMAELVFASTAPLARAALAPLPLRPVRSKSDREPRDLRGPRAHGTMPPAATVASESSELARFARRTGPTPASIATPTEAPFAAVVPPGARHPHLIARVAPAPIEARGELQAVVEPVVDPSEPDQVDLPTEVPATSRKVRPRRMRPRARTIAARRLTSVELHEVASTVAARADRPRTRAECAHEQRPCPWVSCKHHLYLDVNPRTGSIKLNFPDLEPWELEHTCALDVADAGGHTLEEVGDITNLTRERIRQLELRGLLELRGRSRSLR